jgi:uncharacterized membrane protein YfbV (UPF0208 family)
MDTLMKTEGGPMQVCCPPQPSLTEKLTARKESLEADLAQVNEALAILEAQPQTQKLLDIVTRARI